MTFDEERQSEQPATPPADGTAAMPTDPSTDSSRDDQPAQPPIWRADEGDVAAEGAAGPAPEAAPEATPDAAPPAASDAAPDAVPPAVPPPGPAWPAAEPGWPAQAWQPAQPAWPQPSWPAQQGWPPAQPSWPQPQPQQSWPQPQHPWPQAQPGWPPAQPAWSPAPPAWPPVAQPQAPADGAEAPYRRGFSSRLTSRAPQILGLLSAVMIAFGGGMVVDHLSTSAVQPASTASTVSGQTLKDFDVYQQALKLIREKYVGRADLTDQQLLYGSISGMVDALGDTNHSRFLTPQQYQQMANELSGKWAGVGVLVEQSADGFTVVRVIANSPAEAAGVQAGDTIVAVNGTSTVGLTFDQMAALIRGDTGTSVKLSILHVGATKPVDMTMTRAVVAAPIVDWGMVPGTTIADIALFEFDSGAADEIDSAINAATRQGATAIVLDLRSDPGGLADEARGVASEFLSSGVVYIEEDASGNRSNITVDTSRTSTALPMVVLVDHNTASAAEIVAGALQDAHRAKVVGLTTIGTGTVLQPFFLSDGSVVLLGVADWLTPAGHRIFGKGLTPDETVALPSGGVPIDPIDLAKMTHAQVDASTDTELLAALKDLGH
jgi:carboxyl-terminal processing protease